MIFDHIITHIIHYVKHYFGKRYRSFHERVRIMRGCIKYWGVNDIVDCGFINRRSPSRKDRPIKWVRVGMTLDAFESICEELEKQGILKEKERSK